MTRRSLGFIFLGLGLAPLAGGLLLFFSGIFALDLSLNPVARITSPGEVPVTIDEAGVYTLWSDKTVQTGASSLDYWEMVPVSMRFSLIRVSDRKEFPAHLAKRSPATVSTPDRQSFAIGTFEPDMGGPYLLKVADSLGVNQEFSLTKGRLTRNITQFGLHLILTCLLGFFGVVLLALGLVFVLLKRETSSSPLAPPAA